MNEGPQNGSPASSPTSDIDETQEFQMDDSVAGQLSKSAEGAATASPEGKTIGDYVVRGKIGAGGAGEVYKAEHQRMERIVALKVLPKSTPRAVKRFHKEVKAAAKLIHPNIVTAFDAGEHEGMPYLVMEYVEGKALDQLVEDSGPLQVDMACDFLMQAARGLAYAHSRGIVHRDIKPSNLMLDDEGSVKVLDMGLARYSTASSEGAGGDDDSGDLTKAGTVIGTVAYMSPEQTKDAKSVDLRTDIYSLGCTFYYLLTAQPVYSGDMITVLVAHSQQPIPSLQNFREDVPERLDAVYQRMLAKDPGDRYQTLDELTADLEEFIFKGPSRAASAAPQVSEDIDADSPWAAMLKEALDKKEKPPTTLVSGAAAVGIDLGTSMSAIAHVDNKTKKPVTLANSDGELATPSVVMIDGSSIAIGKDALEAVGTKGECLADRIKRDLGRNLYHKKLGGQHYPPEVLLSLILNKIVQDARHKLGDFTQVVITVPAYFGDVRRKAVEDAAYIVGLDLLDILNEPTAAAVTFGFERGLFASQAEAKAGQRILVCDIGGGAFDVSVLEIKDAKLSVKATDGQFVMGGRDWDGQLANRVAKLFHDKYGIDPLQEPNAAGQLLRECETARRTLSDADQATVDFEFEGNPARVTINHRQLASFAKEILDSIRSTIEKTLRRAKVDWAGIDHVLLVGGMSRTPLIRKLLKELSGKEPDTSLPADEAVAHGAALHAAARMAKREGRQPLFAVEEVNSHSMGVVGTASKTGGKVHAILIPRNTRLPASAKRTFKTHKQGQDSLAIQIVQGESKSLKECTLIGKCVIENLPANLPAGTPITVEFRCTANGRLTLYVESPGTGQRITQEIRRPARLAPSELDHWREWLETMALCAGFEGD